MPIGTRRLIATSAASAIMLVAGCSDRQEAGTPGLFVDPKTELGETVTVRGEVAKVVGPLSFEMAGPDGQGLVLVVAALKTTPPSFDEGDELTVTGTVLEFDEDELAEAFAVDLDRDTHRRYDDDPVLVATKVTADDEGNP